MKNRIIYHLVKSENQKCKYAEQLKAKLNEAADEYIEKSVDRENINYDYIHMILIQDREKCMQYSQILFISDEFFGMFCDLNVFLERVIKEGAEIFSLKKTENNLPDFNFLCLDGNILKNDVPDEKTVCDKCTYLVEDGNIKEVYELIKKNELPLLSKELFLKEYKDVIKSNTGEYLQKICREIEKSDYYPINDMWDYVIHQENMSDIVYNNQFVSVLPKTSINASDHEKDDLKKAVIIHIYYEDLIEECYDYVKNAGSEFDIFVTTDTAEKVEKVKEVFSKTAFNKLETILIENRGRDVSALLVGSKKFVMDYDIVCFVHDKKVKQLNDEMVGVSFSNKCYENVLGSNSYVKNIVNYFMENERLGMAFPPPPNHADYYPTLGYFDWGNNYSNVKKLYDELGLTIKISKDKEVVAPLGTMFWFRPAALKDLFNKDWEYSDFPPEPNPNDGTILHAIERIYPFCCQNAGYYVSWILNDEYAGTELNNLYYMIKNLNKKIFYKYGAGSFNEVISKIVNDEEKDLTKELEECNKVAEYYKSKAEIDEKAARDYLELSSVFKNKSEDFEKTLHETQELLKVINAQKEDFSKRFYEVESMNRDLQNKNNIISAEINNMRGTKVWRFRSFVKKILRRK